MPYGGSDEPPAYRCLRLRVQQRELLCLPQERRRRMMNKSSILGTLLLIAPLSVAQQQDSGANTATAADIKPITASAPVRSDFHVRYINGVNVYIDAGRDAGITEGTALVLKQDTSKVG